MKSFQHQQEDFERFRDSDMFALFWEMGLGKSKASIDIAHRHHERGDIVQTLIIAPASVVGGTWLDPEFGEVQKHSPVDARRLHLTSKILKEKHLAKMLATARDPWYLGISYDLVRQGFPEYAENLEALYALVKSRPTQLIIDESSCCKGHQSLQTRAVYELRKRCDIVTLLDGTPDGDSPLDLYCQFKIMSEEILGYKNFYHFRAVHAIMGGYQKHQVVGYKNLEYITKKSAPYVSRRTSDECLDLPPVTRSQLEVKMPAKTWKHYVEMKDDLLTYLDAQPAMAANHAVKMIRLSQLTSGLLGYKDDETGERVISVVDSAKRDFLAAWIGEHALDRAIVWCRFRAEMELLEPELMLGGYRVVRIQGGQSKSARADAIEEFAVRDTEKVILLGQPHAGGRGLNLVRNRFVFYLSNDFSNNARMQSEARCGATRQAMSGLRQHVNYYDVIATGPGGQKTIDHYIIKKLRNKEDMMRLTTRQWQEILRGDDF